MHVWRATCWLHEHGCVEGLDGVLCEEIKLIFVRINFFLKNIKVDTWLNLVCLIDWVVQVDSKGLCFSQVINFWEDTKSWGKLKSHPNIFHIYLCWIRCHSIGLAIIDSLLNPPSLNIQKGYLHMSFQCSPYSNVNENSEINKRMKNVITCVLMHVVGRN